jgi:heat shock protein HslJ
LQETLNRNYGASLKVDGKAGCNTFDAVYELTGLNLSDGVDLNDLNTEE